MCLKRHQRNQFLLLMLICYIVVYYYCDAYLFESAHLVRTWFMTQKVVNSDVSAKSMFTFDKHLLTRNASACSAERKPLILMWKPSFGAVVPDPNACPGCLLTYDQKAAPHADAIIFHCTETRNDVNWLPWKHRNPDQRWVWLCMEPPWNVRHVFGKTLSGFRNVFNWTMTYRVDSDVFASYGEMPLVKRPLEEIKSHKEPSLMAAWVVSNCHSPPRERFVKEIKRFIAVDVYGKCSDKPLCKGRCLYDALASEYSSRNLCREDCEYKTLSKYKFYFSLENSQCRDYITEKFWIMGLGSGAIPVVMGPSRGDYELVAPPHSFIHVNDFPTVRELADYLQLVSRDDQLYENYFRWMNDTEWYKNPPGGAKDRHVTALAESRRFGNANGLCALCQKLRNTPKAQKDVVPELDQWWFGNGYSPKGDSIPICQSGATESGYPLRWAVTLGYTAGFVFVALIVVWVSQIRINRQEAFNGV